MFFFFIGNRLDARSLIVTHTAYYYSARPILRAWPHMNARCAASSLLYRTLLAWG